MNKLEHFKTLRIWANYFSLGNLTGAHNCFTRKAHGRNKRCEFRCRNRISYNDLFPSVYSYHTTRENSRCDPFSETQRRSIGSREKAGRKFSSTGKELLGTDSYRTISKNSSGCRLLIGHKKCFVLLCPIGEQFLLSSFREFVHDGYCLEHGLSGSCTKEMHAVRKLSV